MPYLEKTAKTARLECVKPQPVFLFFLQSLRFLGDNSVNFGIIRVSAGVSAYPHVSAGIVAYPKHIPSSMSSKIWLFLGYFGRELGKTCLLSSSKSRFYRGFSTTSGISQRIHSGGQNRTGGQNRNSREGYGAASQTDDYTPRVGGTNDACLQFSKKITKKLGKIGKKQIGQGQNITGSYLYTLGTFGNCTDAL